jgi:hypothetical protein
MGGEKPTDKLFWRTAMSAASVLAALVLVGYYSIGFGGTGNMATAVKVPSCKMRKYSLADQPGAKCLDGSPAAYYYMNGTVDKWIIFFEGGGWCYDWKQCRRRANTALGSSYKYQECQGALDNMGFMSSNANVNPSETANYHKVYVRYCDGFSFAGDREYPDGKNADGKKKILYSKGSKIREGLINQLFSYHGLGDSSELIVSGGSAGGLAVLMGLDRIAEQVHKIAPDMRVLGLSDSPLFPDFTSGNSSFKLSKGTRGYDFLPDGFSTDYSRGMRSMAVQTNAYLGSDKHCLDAFAPGGSNAQASCVFAQYLLAFIDSPLFVLQSRFDSWALVHVLGAHFDKDAVAEYGAATKNALKDLMFFRRRDGLMPSMGQILKQGVELHSVLHQDRLPPHPPQGLFLTSCMHHCFTCHEWSSSDVLSSTSIGPAANLTAAEAFSDWKKNFNVEGISEGSSVERFFYHNIQPAGCVKGCCAQRCRRFARAYQAEKAGRPVTVLTMKPSGIKPKRGRAIN